MRTRPVRKVQARRRRPVGHRLSFGYELNQLCCTLAEVATQGTVRSRSVPGRTSPARASQGRPIGWRLAPLRVGGPSSPGTTAQPQHSPIRTPRVNLATVTEWRRAVSSTKGDFNGWNADSPIYRGRLCSLAKDLSRIDAATGRARLHRSAGNAHS